MQSGEMVSFFFTNDAVQIRVKYRINIAVCTVTNSREYFIATKVLLILLEETIISGKRALHTESIEHFTVFILYFIHNDIVYAKDLTYSNDTTVTFESSLNLKSFYFDRMSNSVL